MRYLTRLLPRTVKAQIAGLVVLSLAATFAIALGILTVVIREPSLKTDPNAELSRIATVTQLAFAAGSVAELTNLLDTVRRTGLDIDLVPVAELVRVDAASVPRPIRFFRSRLENAYGFDVLEDMQPANGGRNSIVIRLDGERALAIGLAPGGRLRSIVEGLLARRTLAPAVFTLTILTVFIVFLSAYAVRWITRPLSSIAAAADSFGRPSAREHPLSETGPREIAQVARALNEMRTRIRTLVDNRTQMVAAIGHDLRTPLTRLRLRAERCDDATLRSSMLRELTSIDGMIDETLTFLRDDAHSEEPSRVDLPSLLQTICAEFSDVGYAVSYEGLDHLTYPCRPRALTRAITNVVENGTKFGSQVWVSLCLIEDGSVQIAVSDDGPGVPFSLRERAFQPFFKVDAARTTSDRTGFGLGLSIARDVIKAHAGDIVLLERAPRGLTVQIVLPVDSAALSRSDREQVTTA